jgi:hypothetical protein
MEAVSSKNKEKSIIGGKRDPRTTSASKKDKGQNTGEKSSFDDQEPSRR